MILWILLELAILSLLNVIRLCLITIYKCNYKFFVYQTTNPIVSAFIWPIRKSLTIFTSLLGLFVLLLFLSQKQSQILDCFKDSEKSKIRSFGMFDPVSKIPAKNYSKKPNYLPIEGSTSSGLITISSSLKVRRIFRPFFRAGSSGIPIIKKQLRIGVSDGAKYSSCKFHLVCHIFEMSK